MGLVSPVWIIFMIGVSFLVICFLAVLFGDAIFCVCMDFIGSGLDMGSNSSLGRISLGRSNL